MIGQRTGQLDGRARVTGRVVFGGDTLLPGTLHLAVRRSDVAHGQLRAVHVDEARRVPGVVAVLIGDDLAALPIEARFGPVFPDQPILAFDRVRYLGEPVAVVAATDRRTAQAAATLIDVEIDPLPAVFDPLAALEPDAPILHPQLVEPARGFADIILKGREGNIGNRFTLRRGAAAAALARADHVFEQTFRSPAVAHVAFEPHACLARFDGDRLIVVTGTQTPYPLRDSLAATFRLPSAAVQVIVPPMGGAFGGKCYAKVEPLAALVALVTGRPAKIVLDRDEEFLTVTKHAAVITLRTGVTHDGVIVAKQTRAWFNAGAYTDISPRLVKNGGYATTGPYCIDNIDIESMAVYTNLAPAGAFRGYGVSQAAWAHESQMDIIARELGIDAVELRRRNLLREGDAFATGETLHGVHFADVLDDAVSLYQRPTPAAAPATDPAPRRGRGCAVIIKSTITPSTSHAVATLDDGGSLHLLTSTADLGQGAHTALAQIAAGQLGLPVELVRVVAPDTDVTPYDLTTSASRSTAAMGEAVRTAVVDLRRQLLEIAADELEVQVDDLELRAGRVEVRGDPVAGYTVGDLVKRSRRGTLLAQGRFQSQGGLDPETGQGIASEHWHQGAAAVEVEVDPATAKITVLAVRASVYAGRVVNPVNARMQVEGSILFGLGQALFEEIVTDDGFVTNANLSDYAIVGPGDVPAVFEVSLLESPDLDDIHGLGETALPVIMPAVANAVADAVGVRLHELPLTPERVLAALDALQEPTCP